MWNEVDAVGRDLALGECVVYGTGLYSILYSAVLSGARRHNDRTPAVVATFCGRTMKRCRTAPYARPHKGDGERSQSEGPGQDMAAAVGISATPRQNVARSGRKHGNCPLLCDSKSVRRVWIRRGPPPAIRRGARVGHTDQQQLRHARRAHEQRGLT